ncbi:hypothetical protein ACWDV4_19450 [Micromonospora sp. NPDC003197]
MGEAGTAWDEYVQRQRAEMAAMESQLGQWRTGVLTRIEEFEAREAAEREAARRAGGDTAPDVPDGAPPAYLRVQARIEDGDLDWVDVARGDSEDPDIRSAHIWLSDRLAAVRRAFEMVTEDMTDEQAEAAIQAALPGPTPADQPSPPGAASSDQAAGRSGR